MWGIENNWGRNVEYPNKNNRHVQRTRWLALQAMPINHARTRSSIIGAALRGYLTSTI